MSCASSTGSEWARRATRWLVVALLLGRLASPSVAAAQELGVTAEVERPIAATGGDDPTASATELDAQDRPEALDTLGSALREIPGARPISTGAFGAPVSLSLRGADPDQLEVLIGDLPVTTADGSAFDFSSIPLFVLDRVEIYRSGAPTWLGVSGIGGVVRLVPRGERPGPLLQGAFGAGSYGLFHGRAATHFRVDDVTFSGAAGITSSAGDFLLTDDQRTAFDPSDDVERPRQNADVLQGSGLGHLSVDLGDARLSAFVFGLERGGGVPGPASQPTRNTERGETHLLSGLSVEVTEDGRRVPQAGWRVQVAASAGYRRRRFSDPEGEIGLTPRSTDDEAFRAVARVAATGRLAPWLDLTGVGVYTRDQLDPEDALARLAPRSSTRDGGNLALEGRFFGRVDDTRLELRPSARLTVLRSQLSELREDRLGEVTESLAVAPTFRLGGAAELVRGLTISASVASATRVPTPVELFGDRAFLLGSTTLTPERAETVDLGLALRGRAGPVRGRAELRGFVTFASDLIRYRRNSQFQAVPENVASATLAGGELGFAGTITRNVALTGALTLLETWTEHLGQTRQLPLRPFLTAFVRAEARTFDLDPLSQLSVFVDLSYTSASFWDPANTSALPERVRMGVGASLAVWEGRIRIDTTVRDVLDARGVDLLGFPLPGRSWSLALSLRTD